MEIVSLADVGTNCLCLRFELLVTFLLVHCTFSCMAFFNEMVVPSQVENKFSIKTAILFFVFAGLAFSFNHTRLHFCGELFIFVNELFLGGGVE